VILEYVTGSLGAPTTLFILTRRGGDSVTLRAAILPPADSLAGQLARFLALIQHGQDGGLGREFGRALLDPAEAELGAVHGIRGRSYSRGCRGMRGFAR